MAARHRPACDGDWRADQKQPSRRKSKDAHQATEPRRHRRHTEHKSVAETKISLYHEDFEFSPSSGHVRRPSALPALAHVQEPGAVARASVPSSLGSGSTPRSRNSVSSLVATSPRQDDGRLPSIARPPMSAGQQYGSPRSAATSTRPRVKSPSLAEATSAAVRRLAGDRPDPRKVTWSTRSAADPRLRPLESAPEAALPGSPAPTRPAEGELPVRDHVALAESSQQVPPQSPGLESLASISVEEVPTSGLTEEDDRQSGDLVCLPDDDSWLTPGCNTLVSFSNVEKDLLLRYFEMHDADLSNSVSFGEIMDILQDMGRAPESGSREEFALHELRKKAAKDRGAYSSTLEMHIGSELSFDEFVGFLEAYYHAVYRLAFARHDVDKSGFLSDFELQAVFADLIMSAGFELPFADLESMVRDFDHDCNGTLDFPEFCSLMRAFRKLEFEHLQRYSGFEPVAFDYMFELFKSADTDDTGSLSVSQLSKVVEKTLFGALDSEAEVESFVQLFTRVDRDRSCTLDFEEFLRLLRVWGNMQRDSGVKRPALAKNGRRKTIGQRVSTSLAFQVSEGRAPSKDSAEKRTKEIVAEALAHELEDAVLAKQWNLLLTEVQMMRESFEFCDIDGSNFIDDMELELFFDNLGYAPRTAIERAALASLRGLDSFSGDLDFVRILQLVATYSDVVATEVARLASRADGRLLLAALIPALREAGIHMSHQSVVELFEEAGGIDVSSEVDMATLAQMIRITRKRLHLRWRRSFGFDDEFVQHVTAVHAAHSEKGGVDLEGIFAGVLGDLGRAPACNEQRQVLARAVTRVGQSDSQSIPVEEVLLMLRHLDNLELRKRLAREKAEAEALAEKENALAEECHLDAEGLQHLRDLFKEQDLEEEGKIPLVGIHMILKNLGLIKTVSQQKVLNDILFEVAGVASAKLAFIEFQQVLCRLHKLGFF